MKFEKENLDELLQLVAAGSMIELDEIPNIDLYMDQITTFMEDKLSAAKRSHTDKIITKTMINNYTKDKILPPPVKKKYTKGHLIAFILIYYMKPVLSITDISRLFNNSTQDLALDTLYEKFTLLQKDAVINQAGSLEAVFSKISQMEGDEVDRLLLLVLHLIIEANINKQLAEKIIDLYFISPK